MPENNFKKTKFGLTRYLEDRKGRIEKKWSGTTKGYPGNATADFEIKETNNAIIATMTFAGQKMWTMEFGRGHNDMTGDGVSITFLKTKMFKDYSNSSVFSEGRKLASNERYKKAQYRKALVKARKKRALAKENLSQKQIREIKAKYSTQGGQHVYKGEFGDDRTGGKAYNIVRIFTRSGSYSDIDSPNNIHKGSGLGGKYGLNTEAFAFHKGRNGRKAKYKGKSLARKAEPVIGKMFPLRDFVGHGEKTIWSFKKDDSLCKILSAGLELDINAFIKDAIKNR